MSAPIVRPAEAHAPQADGEPPFLLDDDPTSLYQFMDCSCVLPFELLYSGR